MTHAGRLSFPGSSTSARLLARGTAGREATGHPIDDSIHDELANVGCNLEAQHRRPNRR